MWMVQIAAFAKINLYLDIVGVREDKYHLLHSVMQSISLADDISIKQASRKGIQVTCNHSEIPCDETNTAYLAAQYFCEAYDITPEIKIHIDNHIPMQSGLAGGSADAAAVLNGLNRLYGINATPEELRKIGAEVGSDVPFCITGGTSEVEGVGNIIKPIAPLSEDYFIVIAKPSGGMSTKVAYKKYDRYGHPKDTIPQASDLIAAIQSNRTQDICSNMYNVFEHIHNDEDVEAILRTMRENGAHGCMMSGSGTACFGIFADKTRAKHCYYKLKQVSG
ncbi:MAG: 4-(cytidine 5'-diphospho)-2-C-methyl-D-erythritol kinase, partial [Oscillospiraceae bacterium]